MNQNPKGLNLDEFRFLNPNVLDPRPIGVFDSGIGGLSVLNHLMHTFPEEHFVYLGDTARLPYGSKSPSTIQKYVKQNINYLLKKQNIKSLVVACNSASAVLNQIQLDSETDFKMGISPSLFGVITPGASAASQMTKNKKVAVWATRATVNQKSYEVALKKMDPEIQVFQIPCPLLVPLVEEGLWDHPITSAAIDLYLKPLNGQDVDTLVLGCTHYPFLRDSIEKQILKHNLKIRLVNSEMALSENLREAMTAPSTLMSPSSKPKTDRLQTTSDRIENTSVNIQKTSDRLQILLTDEASHFMNIVLKTFPEWQNVKFQLIDLQQIV